MNTDSPALSSFLAKGAFFGAAAFSAYAVVEFFFSSVVYRLTRPYAIFTAWHWKLTAVLLLGYLITGVIVGLVAGLWARRRGESPERSSDLLEGATAAVLALSLILNNLTGPGAIWLGGVQIASALFFLAVIVAGILSPAWRDRLGALANPWIISFTWLAIGLYASLRLRATPESGSQFVLAANLLAGLIVLTAVLAWFLGRWTRRRDPAHRWTTRIATFSSAAGLLLLIASVGLSFDTPSVRASNAGGTGVSRPNVVVVVMDTVRADHLSLNGYSRDTTPNLRALAKDSVVYSNAFAASDITLTSHASLFTGMYPSWHNAYCQPPLARYGRELSPKYPTLAEVLQREGYETLGVAANLYLRADFGLERGFDEFRIPRPVPLLPDEDRSVLRYQMRRALSLVIDTAQFDRLYTFGEDIDREFFSALDQRQRRSSPFFAFLNYMDAHFPYVPPAPYSSRYPGRRNFTQDDLNIDQDLITRGKGQPPEYRPHCESQYDGGIAYIDDQIGQLVNGLKRRGEYENTMIVVTSDHGESFGEKNRVGHANSPYQNLLHVGLIIKYPGGHQTGTQSQPVSLIDVAPTAISAVGAPVPGTMQGVSLLTGAPAPRHIFAETFQNPVSHSPDCPDGCVTKTIVEWPLKFIDNRTTGKQEFFDLSADPQEQHNLFVTQRDRAEALAGHLSEWAKSLPSQSVETKRVNPSIENTLRGNGYVAK